MRLLVGGGLLVALLLVLAGCGGGGGAPLVTDAELFGVWLETAPATTAPVEGIAWPAHCLTLGEDYTFRYEESAVTNWTQGRFLMREGRLAFTRVETRGAVNFFGSTDLAYTLTQEGLGITAALPTGEIQAYQFSRQLAGMLPVVIGEWLLVRRVGSDSTDLPTVDSVQLTLAADGALTMTRQAGDGTLTVRHGTTILTAGGYLGGRFPAEKGLPARVLLFGKCGVGNGVMALRGPDGVQAILATRDVPDRDLIGRWTATVDGVVLTLQIASDGTYTLADGATTASGTWRNYRGYNLCLTGPNLQRTYAYAIKTIREQTTLVLGTWMAGASGTPEIRQTTWTRAAS